MGSKGEQNSLIYAMPIGHRYNFEIKATEIHQRQEKLSTYSLGPKREKSNFFLIISEIYICNGISY